MLIAYLLLLALLLWGYGLYAFPLFLLPKDQKGKAENMERWPKVSFIIPAYNEADYLPEKIKNTRSLDYPSTELEIIIAADGSTDNSDEVATEFGVKYLNNHQRLGKASAMNRVVEHCTGDVLVFTDANVLINATALKAMVTELYSDVSIALVSGEKKVIKAHDAHNAGAGEGLYWKYEAALKKIDSRYHSLIGSVGELFALKKERYINIPTHFLLDDFFVSVKLLEQGHKVKYVSEAMATEYGSSNYKEEAKRKIRIAAGAWQCMLYFKGFFSPSNWGKVSYLYLSHRVLRQSIIPFSLLFFMPLLLVGLVLREPNTFVYLNAFAFAALFFLALLGWFYQARYPDRKVPFFINVPFYILFMNVCAVAGAFRFARGIRSGAWEKSKRAARVD